MNANEKIIADRIIAYIAKHDRCPNFASIGTDWTEGQPIFNALFEQGVLVRDIRVSPKGRKMKIVRLAK